MPILPTHHEKNGAVVVGTTEAKPHHNGLHMPFRSIASEQQELNAQRRERGPLAWNVKKPRQAPVSLAIKNHFVAMVGEFVGTSLFMIFALGGTNVANIPTTSVTGATTAGQDGSTAAAVNTSSLLYIALSFGFSLTVNAWIFFRVSGGLFNPAVSLGMALVGALTPLRAVLLTISQILGGIVGAAIIQAVLPGTLNVRTTLGGGTSVVQGLFLEMFLTLLLMLAILLLAAEKHKATFLAPIGIGLSLFIAEMVGVYYTGGSLNPARSFGPDVVLKTFASYHWIYWLGPAMGASLAAGFYKFIKYLEYETVLGPEADEEKPVAPQGGSGSESADGTSSGNVDNVGQSSVKKGVKLAAMGAGLGDLLTQGEPSAVFDLPEPPNAYDDRIDRMTEMLASLLQAQHIPTPHSSPRGERDSMQTYVGDSNSNGYKHTTGLGSTHENSEGGVRGAYANNGLQSLGNGNAGPNREGGLTTRNVTGETTIAGEAQNGVPLGRRL